MTIAKVTLIKYILVFIISIGIIGAGSWFGYQYGILSKQNANLQRTNAQIEQIYRRDSIQYTQKIDSLSKILIKQDSIIKVKLAGIQLIQEKYNAERAKIRALSADSTLLFFLNQSNISNDW